MLLSLNKPLDKQWVLDLFFTKEGKKDMRKIVLTALLMVLLIISSLIVSADEYNRDEAFISWKLMAYALYPVGYALETIVVKPGHWVFSLPFLRDISGHDELNKGLLSLDSENNFQSYENLKSLYHGTKSHAEETEKFIQDNENLASAGKAITDNSKKFAVRAKTAAAKAEDSAFKSEDAAIKAEEAADKAELAARKAEAVFNKRLKK